MKKDVLILCQYFYPEYVSSATLPTELAEDLVKEGHTIDVLCGYPKEYYNGKKVTKKELYKGIHIKRAKYTEFNNKKKFGRILNFFSFFISILIRLPTLFQYKCIIVYSNPPILPLIPNFISRFSKTKFIFVAFDVYPDNALILGAIKKDSIIEKIMNYINGKVYKNASAIIALGKEMKSYMVTQGISKNPETIRVIPNWYSEEKLGTKKEIINSDFQKLRNEWPFIVLYSGNMGSAQDIETILQCILNMKNRKDVLFVFTGHGNKVNYISEFIEIHEITNVRMYGFLLGNDYSDMLNMADVCLVSLAKGIEGVGVPSKTYGYLAASKPVIAIMSAETDIAKNLKDYNAGSNVIQGDVKGLETIILNYMKNDIQIIGNNARKIYEDMYQRKVCTRKYSVLIKEIINDDIDRVGE